MVMCFFKPSDGGQPKGMPYFAQGVKVALQGQTPMGFKDLEVFRSIVPFEFLHTVFLFV